MAQKHHGTHGLAPESALSRAYDDVAPELPLYPEFYRWVSGWVLRSGVPRDAAVLDVGCGVGAVLEALAARGYTNLAGVDFSERSVALASARVPGARVWRHNLVEGPLEPVDAVVMTEVIEHLSDPVGGLRNVRASLRDDGWLILTFPNRDAYWPLIRLSGLARRVASPRLRHWLAWFTMPYEMRSTQPLDHSYAVADVRGFLGAAGFRVVAEDGISLLPMLRIGGLGWVEALRAFTERTVGRLLPRWLFYRYMLICRPARSGAAGRPPGTGRPSPSG